MIIRFFNYLLLVIATILIAASLIPLLPFENWYVRMLDFPRLQILVLTLLVLIIFIIFRRHRKSGKIFISLLFITSIYQFIKILPYTPLSSVQALSAKPNPYKQTQIKLLVANVLMTNNRHQNLIALIQKEDPDIFLTLESDEKWQSALEELKPNYPNIVNVPQDNTYGMHLYSKLPIYNTEVTYWLDKEIPSINTLILLHSGDTIQFYGVHPKPPVPTEDENSRRRDAEIMIIGNRAANSKYPVIVAGDFNDVAWSPTTQLFLKSSRLLDPRLGRGFYNTYNVNSVFFRWPLDHFFYSTHFKLINLKRLPSINSDHFPIAIHLNYDPEEKASQKPLKPDKDTKKIESETINEGIEDSKKEE